MNKPFVYFDGAGRRIRSDAKRNHIQITGAFESRFMKYEKAKKDFLANNPNASSEAYEDAVRALASQYGI